MTLKGLLLISNLSGCSRGFDEILPYPSLHTRASLHSAPTRYGKPSTGKRRIRNMPTCITTVDEIFTWRNPLCSTVQRAKTTPSDRTLSSQTASPRKRDWREHEQKTWWTAGGAPLHVSGYNHHHKPHPRESVHCVNYQMLTDRSYSSKGLKRYSSSVLFIIHSNMRHKSFFSNFSKNVIHCPRWMLFFLIYLLWPFYRQQRRQMIISPCSIPSDQINII